MPFNGSGVFALYTPGNPVVTGTTISSTVQNNTMSDIATGLSTCILKDGSQTATASVPFVDGIGVGTANAFAVSSAGTLTSTSTSAQVVKGPIDASASTAGQLKFPATQNASSNANTLDDYVEGTFTATLTGCTTSPTFTVKYIKIGDDVTLTFPATAWSATSNTTAKTLTGMPSNLFPAASVYAMNPASDNGGAFAAGLTRIGSDGVIHFYPTPTDGALWTNSGTANVACPAIGYSVA